MNFPTEHGKKEIRINLQCPSLHVIFPFREVVALFWGGVLGRDSYTCNQQDCSIYNRRIKRNIRCRMFL